VSNAHLGMLMLIAAETMLFTGLIGAFLVFRFGSVTWPPLDQPRLPIGITAVNTVILLLSGYTMYRAITAIGQGNQQRFINGLLETTLLGVMFLSVQGSEWIRLIRYGFTLSDGTYGSTFYTLIGCHGLHVLGAIIWLLAVLVGARQGRYSAQNRTSVEICGMYWYFVVALWPFLFTLVYLS
jgi:heme/copper-type cytochrome/quinol oxidase subunit 3